MPHNSFVFSNEPIATSSMLVPEAMSSSSAFHSTPNGLAYVNQTPQPPPSSSSSNKDFTYQSLHECTSRDHSTRSNNLLTYQQAGFYVHYNNGSFSQTVFSFVI